MICARCGCHRPNPECYVCWDNGERILRMQARDEWMEAQDDERRDEILIEKAKQENERP